MLLILTRRLSMLLGSYVAEMAISMLHYMTIFQRLHFRAFLPHAAPLSSSRPMPLPLVAIALTIDTFPRYFHHHVDYADISPLLSILMMLIRLLIFTLRYSTFHAPTFADYRCRLCHYFHTLISFDDATSCHADVTRHYRLLMPLSSFPTRHHHCCHLLLMPSMPLSTFHHRY